MSAKQLPPAQQLAYRPGDIPHVARIARSITVDTEQWSDVELRRGTITVRREKAKDFERREIPLSQEAVSVLRRWRMQTGGFLVQI